MTDIFNVQDDSLPAELKVQTKSKGNAKIEQIIELFKVANRPLNINEALTGFYNMYKEVEDKTRFNIFLNQLINKGYLVREKRGVFSLAEAYK